MRHLGTMKNQVHTWRSLERKVADLYDVAALAVEEGDSSLEPEVDRELSELTAQFDGLESQLMFSSDYDRRNAIISLHSGAGGIESQDWASMLLRMYLRWAERHHYQTEILDSSPGEEAGIKSAVVEVKGEYAYGYLRGERGVHRLVRLSPFDADHARHTSFALAEVIPEAEEALDIDINPADLKVETFRSSGPGGQHMQKTSSAVRITHLPTGIVATCQEGRSQYQNKEVAQRILYARLLDREIKIREKENDTLRGKHVDAAWGNQIRSYVLHPYQMVKDHRTGYETGNAEAVLDGNLDKLIDAYLRFEVGEK